MRCNIKRHYYVTTAAVSRVLHNPGTVIHYARYAMLGHWYAVAYQRFLTTSLPVPWQDQFTGASIGSDVWSGRPQIFTIVKNIASNKKRMVSICLYCLNCTKFCQLILRNIIKIVATGWQSWRLKCTRFDLICLIQSIFVTCRQDERICLFVCLSVRKN